MEEDELVALMENINYRLIQTIEQSLPNCKKLVQLDFSAELRAPYVMVLVECLFRYKPFSIHIRHYADLEFYGESVFAYSDFFSQPPDEKFVIFSNVHRLFL